MRRTMYRGKRPGVGGGGGGGADKGLENGWTYLALSDATHVVRTNSGLPAPGNVILSQADDGTEWTISHHATWGVDDSGSMKNRNLVGVGDYWHFPLPESLAYLNTWKIWLKLEITDFGTGDEDDLVYVGIGDCGDGTQLADINVGRYAYGGLVNDKPNNGSGLMQPDVRYGVKKGSAGGSQSGFINANEGEANTIVVEVCKVGANITTAVISLWRPVPIGAGTKLRTIYHATAGNLVVSDLKMVIQIGRQSQSSTNTTIKFKAHYMVSTEATETDFGI
jgi:hypothetical protein